MPQSLTATAGDGVGLAVSVEGEGPLLLMIPGLGATRRVYDPIVPRLAERLRVAVFDPRGVGDSAAGEPPYTLSQLAADAVAVLDALGADRAAVFGASMGGMVAQHVVLEHPGRVERLILACTNCGGRHVVRAERAAREALLGRGASNPEEAYRLATTVLYESGWAARHREEVEAEIAWRGRHPVSGRAFLAQYEATRALDTCDRLPTVAVPTLVIHGSADAVQPAANAEVIARRVPGARLLLLEGRGHLFWHEDPARSAEAIADFVLGRPVGEPVEPAAIP